MLKIGFDVEPWKNKNFKEFSNEEILEYWYKLRFEHTISRRSSEITEDSPMGDMYLADLQAEIINRMK